MKLNNKFISVFVAFFCCCCCSLGVIIDRGNQCRTDSDCVLSNAVCYSSVGIEGLPSHCACQVGQTWDVVNQRCDYPDMAFTTSFSELINIEREHALFYSEYVNIRTKDLAGAQRPLLPSHWQCDTAPGVSSCWSHKHLPGNQHLKNNMNYSLYIENQPEVVQKIINDSYVQHIPASKIHIQCEAPLVFFRLDATWCPGSITKVCSQPFSQLCHTQEKIQQLLQSLTLHLPNNKTTTLPLSPLLWFFNETSSLHCISDEDCLHPSHVCWETRQYGSRCGCKWGTLPNKSRDGRGDDCITPPSTQSRIQLRRGGGLPLARTPWLVVQQVHTYQSSFFRHVIFVKDRQQRGELVFVIQDDIDVDVVSPTFRLHTSPNQWWWRCNDPNDLFFDRRYDWHPIHPDDWKDGLLPHCRGMSRVCEQFLPLTSSPLVVAVDPLQRRDGQCNCSSVYSANVTGYWCDTCSREDHVWLLSSPPRCIPQDECDFTQCNQQRGYCPSKSLFWNSRTTRQCVCQAHYFGERCTLYHDECTDQYCSSVGVCENSKTDNYVDCLCDPGFTGLNCSLTYTECTHQRGGVCLMTRQGSICPRYYSLPNCTVVDCHGGIYRLAFNEALNHSTLACECPWELPTWGEFCQYPKCANNATFHFNQGGCHCQGVWRLDANGNCTAHICGVLDGAGYPNTTAGYNFTQCICQTPLFHVDPSYSPLLASEYTRSVCIPNCTQHGQLVWMYNLPFCRCDYGYAGFLCDTETISFLPPSLYPMTSSQIILHFSLVALSICLVYSLWVIVSWINHKQDLLWIKKT